jgi:hypothetical protein
MEQGATCIYRKIQRQTISVVYAPVNATQSPSTATHWTCLKDGDLYKNTRHFLHHYIGQKHTFFHVKFKVGLCIPLSRKCMSNKKWHFSWGNSKAVPFGGISMRTENLEGGVSNRVLHYQSQKMSHKD